MIYDEHFKQIFKDISDLANLANVKIPMLSSGRYVVGSKHRM